MELLACKARDGNLELAALIDPGVPRRIVGDVTRLRQVLMNLLSNALKFTHEGEVTVRIEAEPCGEGGLHEIRIAVRDTGIGIPAERLGRLFKAFSQVDSSTTRRYGGSGLGLAISKRLVELMGGTMAVESEVGRGSTFSFSFQTRAGTEAAEPELQRILAGKHVLIVDDNETNRFVLTRQASNWGLDPRTVATPAQALTRIEAKEHFDVAILDLCMPEVDGIELARQIRKTRPGRRLPMILLSSVGAEETRGLAEGDAPALFGAILTKPAHPDRLRAALAQLLGGDASVGRERAESKPIDSSLGQRLPMRILLAEDNHINQKVALKMLERMGYIADVAPPTARRRSWP